MHKRDCPIIIRLASQKGDQIQTVDFEPDGTLYPVTVTIRAVDRIHLFVDIAECISKRLNLNMDRYESKCENYITTMEISFGIHSFSELESIIKSISEIEGVDEVKQKLD